MAKIADAFVGVAPVGKTSSGFINPAMEKPLATKTFSAVSAEAKPILSADRGVVCITDAPNRAYSVRRCLAEARPTGRLQVVGVEGVALVHVAGGEAAFEPFYALGG